MPIEIVFFLMHVHSSGLHLIEYFQNFLFLNNLHEIDTNVMMFLDAIASLGLGHDCMSVSYQLSSMEIGLDGYLAA